MEENQQMGETPEVEEKQVEEAPQMEQKQEEVVEAEPVTNTQDSAQETSTSDDVEKNKGMAILAYILFFIPMLTEAKDSKFAMFHANQSLILLIAGFVGMFVSGIIPILGWFVLGPIISIVWIVFLILGILNASKGEMKELPLIGGIHILDKK